MANWYDSIPVPTDANGREVPLDTKELLFDGEVRAVKEIGYKLHNWVVRFVGEEDFEFLHDCTMPDSWERLEEDVRDTRDVRWSLVSCRYYCHDTEDSCVGCPARSEDNCENAVLVDIVRRAKALAGVTDGE